MLNILIEKYCTIHDSSEPKKFQILECSEMRFPCTVLFEYQILLYNFANFVQYDWKLRYNDEVSVLV